MKKRRLHRTLLVAAAVTLAGCASVIGLSDFEITDLDAGADANAPEATVAPVTDAGTDANADATVVLPPVTCIADAGTCTALNLDGGWRPVAMTPGNAICPDGFGEATTTRGMPATAPGACDCAVATTTPPTSCADTNATMSFLDGDSGTTCIVPSQGKFAVSSGCASTTSGFAFEFAAFVPPPATGASCTAKTVTDPTKVATSPITLCPPAGTCTEAVCGGEKLGPLRACIVADGDVACPTVAFTSKIPIGSTVATATCSDCSCAIASETCGGSFNAYPGNPNCNPLNGGVFTVDAGACSEVAHMAYKSYHYAADPSVTGIADGGRTLLGATFGGPRTLCCVP